jgi:hypothetical protein
MKMIKGIQKDQFNTKTKGGENRMKKIGMITIMLAFILTMTAQVVFALPMLTIWDSNGNTMTVNDNVLPDGNSFAGGVTWVGSLGIPGNGMWTIQIDSGISTPLTSAPYPHMDLSVVATSNGAGVLYVLFSDSANVNGTMNSVATGSQSSLSGTSQFYLYQDYGTNQQQLISTLGLGQSTSGLASPISTLDMLTVLTSRDSGTWSTDFQTQVPEPGILLLLGSGFAGLAFYARRKRQ